MKASFANTPLRIALDGEELETAEARRITSVLVRQKLSTPSLVEISFAEPSIAFVKTLRFGSAVKLATSADDALFEGEITGIEYLRDGAEGRIVRIRGYDRLHRLRKKQRARAVAETSVSQFFTDTMREIDIDCEAAETGPERRLIVQYNESDLDFLTTLGAQAGLFFFLEGGTLHLGSLAGRGEPTELQVGRELSVAHATANAESMRRTTDAKAWDVLRTAVVEGTASTARQDKNDIHVFDNSAFGDLGKRTLFNLVAGHATEVQGRAQADMDWSASRDIIIEATSLGQPAIRPGRTVKILGLGDTIDGIFTVTCATHSFSELSGYLTEFSTEPPLLGRVGATGSIFTFGSVVNVRDPDRLSRVRARLPLLGDVTTDWMPVVVPGAGLDKGLAVMPEIEDEVLIVFPQGDPAYGLVLGGLYGERKSPGLVDDGVRPFAFRTGNGQAITLDAAKGTARIETSGGDFVEMGPGGAHLHATQDLVIEAPGHKLTIRAASVEFEQG